MDTKFVYADTLELDLTLEEQIQQVKAFNNPEMVPLMLEKAPVDNIDDPEGDFGKSLGNPIPVNGIYGELIYLSLLACDKCRNPVFFHRHGSVHLKKGSTVVDTYEVCCANGCIREKIHLAPYYPKRSKFVPTGYIARIPNYKEDPNLKTLLTYPYLLGYTTFVENFPYGMEKDLYDYCNFIGNIKYRHEVLANYWKFKEIYEKATSKE